MSPFPSLSPRIPGTLFLLAASVFPLRSATGPRITWSFDGGSADRAEILSENHARVHVHGETDQDGRNRQASWYYFRVDGAQPGREFVIDLVGLPGEYNYQPNKGAITKDTPPFASFDAGRNWTPVRDFEYDSAEPRLRIRVKPSGSTFLVAHVPPYTGANLEALRSEVRRSATAREEALDQGLLHWTIASPSKRKKKRVFLMFRQHSWEAGSSWVGEGAVRALLANPGDAIEWHILPMADPWGVARGSVRFNRNGFDLNRNWDVQDPAKMPEITAQRKVIAAHLPIDLFFSLHNTETSEYLEAQSPEHRALAERFFALLKERSSFSPTRPLFFGAETTTPGKAGRMNVIQGLWRDYKVPGFLMERRIAGLPLPPEHLKFGRELVDVIKMLLAQ